MTEMDDSQLENILNSTQYATISTVDEKGSPWAAPVWYVVDESNSVYWWSPKDSQHSKNIAVNPEVYITIFDSTLPEGKGLGLYIRAEALELSEEDELQKAVKLYNASTEVFKLNLENCLGKSPTRVYKATPSKMWVNADSQVNGYFIDTRKELNLEGK